MTTRSRRSVPSVTCVYRVLHPLTRGCVASLVPCGSNSLLHSRCARRHPPRPFSSYRSRSSLSPHACVHVPLPHCIVPSACRGFPSSVLVFAMLVGFAFPPHPLSASHVCLLSCAQANRSLCEHIPYTNHEPPEITLLLIHKLSLTTNNTRP